MKTDARLGVKSEDSAVNMVDPIASIEWKMTCQGGHVYDVEPTSLAAGLVQSSGRNAVLLANHKRRPTTQSRTKADAKSTLLTFVKDHSIAILLQAIFAVVGYLYFGSLTSSKPQLTLKPVVTSQAPQPRLVAVNIEDVKEDDYILAKDPITGEMTPRKVLKTFSRISDHVRCLILRSPSGIEQEIGTTDEHPFFIEGNIEVKAGQLHIGDKIIQHDGNFAILKTSHREEHPEGIAVYNFEVEGFHTYFVSAQGSRAPPVWVHNAKCKDDLAPISGGKAFIVEPRVIGQLADSRLGSLAGKITPQRLHELVNNNAARRFFDARSGNINIIQEVEGRLVRITVAGDKFKIISVGPIQERNIANLIKNGGFFPLP